MPLLWLLALTLQTPTLKTKPGAEEVRLDGRLTEPVWATADSIASLTQIEPVEGGRSSGSTVVRVLTNPRYLVIGVTIANGGVPVTTFSKARDASLSEEDHIRLVFDPFGDGRSGYLFAVNPSGARYDALTTNQGEGANSNWDAVWEAATASSDSGWSVEIRIPVKSLSFPAGADQWAFNVQRRVQAALATDRWAATRRDRKFGQTSNAGRLIGLPRFDLGRGQSLRPAVVTGGGKPGPNAPVDGDLSLSAELEQRLGANFLGTLSLNTDFAETEVDTRRSNLTRFPLFFPEKRTFFLEGSDVFEFGPNLGTDVLPFFSRRIGLVNGREVPLQAGGKLTGQFGSTRAGLIATRTGSVDSVVGATEMAVLRVRQNVLRESSIGAIATLGDPNGGTGWLAGADATFRTSRFRGSKNLLVGAWYLGADRPAAGPGDQSAFGFLVDYPNDLVDASVSWKRIGDAFDPPLGFVPRRGVNLISLGADVSPRPERWGIRQMFFENRLTMALDLDGRWESYRLFVAPINWRFEGGDRIEVNVAPQGERLAEPFEVADGVVVRPGSYRYTRYRLEAELAARRRVGGQLTWWFGNFYGGRLDQFQVEASWRPSATLAFELNGEHNRGRLPEGGFTTTVVGGRIRYNVSPNVSINSLVQYDTESRTIGSNSRLRWTITPTAELFVIYNHNLRDRLDRWSFESNRFLTKFQYTFRR